jgi:hypothetical protein
MKSAHSSNRRSLAFGMAAPTLVVGVSLLLATAVLGQGQPPAPGAADDTDQAQILAGLEVFKEAGCRSCHGWAANGEAEGPNPRGPSLRATETPMDAIRLAVACGRPGTEMPYFWSDAYRLSSNDCYGMTRTQMGNLLPPRSNPRFSAEEIDAVTYYIENYVKGRGDITFEECEFYFGEANQRCTAYPHDPG